MIMHSQLVRLSFYFVHCIEGWQANNVLKVYLHGIEYMAISTHFKLIHTSL